MSIGPDVGAMDAIGGFLVLVVDWTFVWTMCTCAWVWPRRRAAGRLLAHAPGRSSCVDVGEFDAFDIETLFGTHLV